MAENEDMPDWAIPILAGFAWIGALVALWLYLW